MNLSEYQKDLSDQIRSEIREFYTVNAAFLIANSFLLGIARDFKDFFLNEWNIIVLIIINYIWFCALLLADNWIKYWIAKANDTIKKQDEGDNQNEYYIWSEKENTITLFKVSLRKLFYTFPVLFSLLFLTMTDYSQKQLLILLGILLGVFVLSFIGICDRCKN